jgi:hypothetical protein
MKKAGVCILHPPATLNFDAPACTRATVPSQAQLQEKDDAPVPAYPYYPAHWIAAPPPPPPQFFPPTAHHPYPFHPFGPSAPPTNVIPSSDSINSNEEPIYPLLSDWFHELDYGVPMSTKYNFGFHVDDFKKAGLMRLHHLFDCHLFPEGPAVDKLIQYVPNLSPGAAAALIKYSKQEWARIKV